MNSIWIKTALPYTVECLPSCATIAIIIFTFKKEVTSTEYKGHLNIFMADASLFHMKLIDLTILHC